MKTTALIDDHSFTSALQLDRPDPASPWANAHFDNEDFDDFIRVVTSEELEEAFE